MVTRRELLGGIGALLAAPAVVHGRIALGQARTLLTADAIYYVSPSGLLSADGLSPETPWPLLQYGIDYLKQFVDFGGHNVVLQAASGSGVTYAEKLKIYGAMVGQGAPESFTIRGNVGNPANCLLSAMGGLALDVLHGARCYIEGFAVESDVGCLSTARATELNFDAVEFRSGGAYHCHAGPHSSLRALGSYKIKGSAGRHADVARGQFQINGNTQAATPTRTVVTIDGKLTFPYFVNAIEQALVDIVGPAFAYAPDSAVVNGTDGARYNVDKNSEIRVGGAGPDYLPGDKPGIGDGLYG